MTSNASHRYPPAGRCAIRVVVFDFDGTLVDSNRIKRSAFDGLDPDDGRFHCALRRQIAAAPEASRYVVLDAALREAYPGMEKRCRISRVRDLAARYDEAVIRDMMNCPEIPGAGALLEDAAAVCPLYLSSVTPEDSLLRLVQARGWLRHFRKVYGYPATKPQTLRLIMGHEDAAADEMVVFGDGTSDRDAAGSVGCRFVQAGRPDADAQLRELLGC